MTSGNPAPGDPGAIDPFTVARLPRIVFGSGRFALVPEAVARYGRSVLIVTGGRSLRASDRWPWLCGDLDRLGVDRHDLAVEGEPSPERVDGAVEQFRSAGIEVVLGIGGGSVLDTAKAIAGLLQTGTRVMDHLEVVGRGIPYPGPSLPFMAVPTTAGTGSEATKNAVLSVHGADGFKRSFRDEALVAVETIVDPDLLASCPRDLIAADGMDALAQLLESYVSTGASPFTDALALSGLAAARDGLVPWHAGPSGKDAPAARSKMACAALLSGICLAQAGLGVVHGLSAPLGAFFPVPHGVACGATLAPAVEANVRALSDRAPDSVALERFATLGRLLAGLPESTPATEARSALITTLQGWSRALGIAGLAAYGVTEGDFFRIVPASRAGSMRSNPVVLTDDELAQVLRASL